MKAKAKNNVQILMEDGRFSNFLKGHEYRMLYRGDDVILMDEDKCGYICDRNQFAKDFEQLND